MYIINDWLNMDLKQRQTPWNGVRTKTARSSKNKNQEELPQIIEKTDSKLLNLNETQIQFLELQSEQNQSSHTTVKTWDIFSFRRRKQTHALNFKSESSRLFLYLMSKASCLFYIKVLAKSTFSNYS